MLTETHGGSRGIRGEGPGRVSVSTASTTRDRLLLIRGELGKVLVGQKELVDRLLIGLLTGGHLLLEGVPGLAKTLAARLVARAVGAEFGRIAFTPDLLPADVVGTEVFHPRTGEFTVRRGPVFVQILLADEINRAPAKVQSALLQAMQERRVTLGGETLALPEPFLVLATQNPIEHEGTYRLPEAQLDRFLMKVVVRYPSREEEREIVERMALASGGRDEETQVDAVVGPEDILELRGEVDRVHVDEKVTGYALDLVRATREPREYSLDVDRYIELGASPRGSIGLVLAGRAMAFLEGRDYVVPHDVKRIALDVLRHRVILNFEAEADGLGVENVLSRILSELRVP